MSDTFFKLRSLRRSDERFVRSSWVKSYRKHECKCTASWYWRVQQLLIDQLLKTSTIKVAVDSTDDTQILGYIVGDTRHKPTLHFIYVKNPFRRLGIGTTLFRSVFNQPGEQVICTHYTHSARKRAADWCLVKEGETQ